MTPMRWAALAAALVATFAVSLIAGAAVRQMVDSRGTAPPVADGLAAPTLAPIATPTPSSTPTPTPMATSTPTSTPTPAPTPAPTPTAAPTPTPTPPPTPSPTPAAPSAPTPTPGELEPPTAEDFADELSAAIRDSDEAYLNERLHPEVITRYGAEQCAHWVTSDIAGDDIRWEVRSSSGPQEWDYASDDLSTIIADAWILDALQAQADPPERELHFAPSEGTWRWFTDCGEPV